MEAKGEYVTKAYNHRDRLKDRMRKEGWTYVGQEGAGYFFEKNGHQTIITAKQIWNRNYIVFKVKDDAVDTVYPALYQSLKVLVSFVSTLCCVRYLLAELLPVFLVIIAVWSILPSPAKSAFTASPVCKSQWFHQDMALAGS